MVLYGTQNYQSILINLPMFEMANTILGSNSPAVDNELELNFSNVISICVRRIRIC